jgi:hypothetical protein
LIELWLTLVHGALCRQVAGGLLVRLPAGVELIEGEETGQQLALVFDATDREQLQQEAQKLFGTKSQLVRVANDLKRQAQAAQLPGLSLRRALSELQSHLVDEKADLPADVAILAFVLRQGDYRSRHVPLSRVSYHIVPHPDGWQLNRQGQDGGEIFPGKEQAVQAGMTLASTHAASQLIIHRADGTFEEGRTYGDDPRE